MRRTLPRLAALLWLTTAPVTAETVTFRFEPPALEAQAICAARAPDAEVIARWAAWDGLSLEGWDIAQMPGEMRRLRELDAVRWADGIEAAIALLPTVSSGYTPEKALMDRIDLMVSAGRLRDLQALGLVNQLLALADSPASSPRVKLALSRLLRLGRGIAADQERGMTLLVEAALGGNADALLEIVALQQDGVAVPGWTVSPDLAVAMAFGALVGQLDPMICDRVTRIAREYQNGNVVTRDMGLAERWFRFAADLGDTDAAWKVAELHMRSEDLVKDNDVLLTYLNRAAASGAPFMLLALGRVYEVGALAPQDLDRAAELYDRAAATGDRAALMRQVQFLAGRLDAVRATDAAPAAQARLDAALDLLAAREDAPTWALTAKAERLLDLKGRWAGEAEATVYLERAAARQDGQAIQLLAGLRLRQATTPAAFYEQVDALAQVVLGEGMIDPMADLQDAFTCRAPNAPQAAEAAYWRDVEDATGTRTVNFDLRELRQLALSGDPTSLARLQTQALYGRPAALAQYLSYLDMSGAPETQRAFWAAYAQRFDKVAASLGRIYLDNGDPALTLEARGFLEEAVARGDSSAEVVLARALLATPGGPSDQDRARAVELLMPAAERGRGAALVLLPQADPARWPTPADVLADFAPAVEAAGDFEALTFALPLVAEEARADILARATAVTTCTFEQAVALMDALERVGDAPGMERWAAIAESLAARDPWQMTALADRLYRQGDPGQQERAFGLFQAAWDQDFLTAGLRLLTHVSDEKSPRYDTRRAADLYAELVQVAEPDQLVTLLARLSKDEAEIQALARDRVDPGPLYLKAAIAGEPVAMREYGLILLAGAETADAAGLAAKWLAQAAEAGDGRAMVEYAQLLAFGIGVPASRAAALEWLQRAADLGVEDAAILTRSLALTVPGQ